MPSIEERAGVPWTTVAILIAALLLGVVIAKSPWNPWGRLDLIVSKPTLTTIRSPSDERLRQIGGSFRLERSVDGIQSKGVAGACLIGDFADRLSVADATAKGVVKSPCNVSSDCNPTATQKWEGSCIRDYGAVMGTCWYRPVEVANIRLVCNTSGMNPGGAPWQVGIDHQTPKDQGFSVGDFYTQYTGGKPVRWRVSGRISRTTDPTPHYVFGEPACISPGGQPC